MDGDWLQVVLVQFSTEQELRTTYNAIHGKGILIDGHQAALDMQSQFIDLCQLPQGADRQKLTRIRSGPEGTRGVLEFGLL